MTKPLRVLVVEDSEDDALLAVRELRRGYDPVFERVETGEAMAAALENQAWDIVIADYQMPHFNALDALKLSQQSGLDLPFIIVSGAIGEDMAVEAMKAGAHDYVMKGNLARLAPAVERELREAEVRRERKRAEEALRRSNRHLEQALTELQRTQQQFVQQERLRALGQMASGIAHDFNNALSPILGFSNLLLTRPEALEDRQTVTRYLHMINMAAQDGAAVVRRMREFYRNRDESETFALVNIDELVEEAILLTQPSWKEEAQAKGVGISVQTDLQGVPPLSGSQSQLREVLTNLILNAVGAMPEGGTITIRTRTNASHV
ncbi:MAG: response regulator, partial [Dehalococcoidia bacterium]